MRNKLMIIFTIVVLTIIVSACQGDESRDDNENNIQDETINETGYENIVQANNDFGFRVIDAINENEDNIFISPISLYTAISMVYPSATDETKAEMKELLQIESLSLEEMTAENASLYTALQIDEADDISLHIANSIWVAGSFELKEDYMQTIEEEFHGKISSIDVTDTSAVDEMNDWVSDQTENKIKEVVEAPLADDFVAMLLNAVYFNGKWQYPFDEDATEEAVFHTAKDKEKQVDFMQVQADFDYVETDEYEGIRLPYGKEGGKSMYAYLPKKTGDLESVHQAFLEEEAEVVFSNMEEKAGQVTFPKFELEYEQSMNDVLKQLGMKRAFEHDDAQLSNMITGDNPLHISEVKHRTYLDINEAGTEAAASTNVGIETTSAIIENPFEIMFDHPFVILIVDESTGAILFIGDINDIS